MECRLLFGGRSHQHAQLESVPQLSRETQLQDAPKCKSLSKSQARMIIRNLQHFMSGCRFENAHEYACIAYLRFSLPQPVL